MSVWAAAGVGFAGASAVMASLWTIQLRTRNAGIVDVGWAVLVGALALLACVVEDGWVPRRLAVAAIMGCWGARLGVHLLRDRVLDKPEDGRYAELRARWGVAADSRFFWFFQLQALAAVFFALPAFLSARGAVTSFSMLELAALLVWVLAFAGEIVADRQLAAFRADPSHRGRTCRSGLWRFSRHPNYFFEWLMWVAYALFAIDAPGGLAALACPVLMLYLLFRVTGIPATEAQALRSRGEDYRRYQRTTSMFFPWVSGS